MKTLKLDCGCKHSTCNTYVMIYVDEEKPQNFILEVKDDKNEFGAWFTFDREMWNEIDSFVRSKYGRK